MPASPLPKFDTDEILWYDNGKWGSAGYAIPNPAGKTWTNNSVIYSWALGLGRMMFELAHRDDVRFHGPPHKQFWFDLHQTIITGRKRLADQTRMPNDSNGLVPQHVTPNPQVFLVYPVPFFGERIRQQDVRSYIQLMLMGLSEAMQHSDNEHMAYVTPQFTGTIGKYLQEVLAQFSMKFFGKTREIAYALDFALTDEDFQNYDPSKVLSSVEMTEERPPLQWHPTENDLSQIRGIQINEALMLSRRWPHTDWMDQADGNIFPDPTRQGTETNTQGSGVVPATAAGGTVNVGFTTPPGQAP
jgi:hypothetical protein